MRFRWVLVYFVLFCVSSSAAAQDLILNGAGMSMTLGGEHRYGTVRLTNGARITVPPFNGSDRVNTGNLVLIANTIEIDAMSSINATGSGYQTVLCGDGGGPNRSGGRGGCAVRDSGGGGGHFGAGGRGTVDNPMLAPDAGPGGMLADSAWEEDCVNSLNMSGSACTTRSDCRNHDALPTVAGAISRHSLYAEEFGGAGGDKGCRDNDGFTYNAAGPGGGRIVLVSVNDARTGRINIDGSVIANGRRGCGTENDSGGGGAGGTVFIVADRVTVGASAQVRAAGGLGGDTAGSGVMERPECAGGQFGGTCDDCGGGGGGGIVAIQSRTSNYAPTAIFDVNGAVGGTCAICQGEAGGSAGELQLTQAYVGEVCDGYDNDFDGMTDEGLGNASCGLGMCAVSRPACMSGSPTACAPTTSGPTCFAARGSARPRVAVVLDTSASMLLNLAGEPTFGDGTTGHLGIDTNSNGRADDSRLYLARNALAEVISAYPEIDFALARYHQDSGTDRSCQTASWIECANLVASYDNPTNNTGALACTKTYGSRTVMINRDPVGPEHCIHYVGSCGAPRRGADILGGFGSATRDLVKWVDGRETNFNTDETVGNYCRHATDGDCEVRGTGPTPLAGSLQAITDYVVPIRTTDPSSMCRGYSVILVTDGAESCDGDPVAAARTLFMTHGIRTYVVAVSVLMSERTSLNAIAAAGGTSSATFVTAPEQLVPALTSIIAGSIRFERCNGIDDDCDGQIDEDFTDLGAACDDGRVGICRGTGARRCRMDGSGTECGITTPGAMAGTEVCNGRDDNCNGRIDEGLSCTGACTPTGAESCNGVDDNCNGAVDESDPRAGMACGDQAGMCMRGTLRCVAGMLQCVGGTASRPEVCNGLDDDCDGVADDTAPCPGSSACVGGACRRSCNPAAEFPCPVGYVCAAASGGSFCLPTPCATCTSEERCQDGACVDACLGVTCGDGLQCRRGQCVGCEVTGCGTGQACVANRCVRDPCADVSCGARACVDGQCQDVCDETSCGPGQSCGGGGMCVADPCAGVSCGAGEVCAAGTCMASACGNCGAGMVCAEGRCIGDPCALVDCPSGATCRLGVSGMPYCGPARGSLDAGVSSYVSTAGGGLCAVGANGGDRAGSWALLAMAIAFVSRRRRV